jgi:HK97 family phage prohead protease
MTVLYGYAREWWALDDHFGKPGHLGKQVRARFAPGAFDRCISRRTNVKLLWNHDHSIELGSVRGGNLDLFEDCHGLAFVLKLASGSEPYAEMVKAGRVRHMSIGFQLNDYQYERSGGEWIWTVTDSWLSEISLCPEPASHRTIVSAAEHLPLFMIRRRLNALEAV